MTETLIWDPIERFLWGIAIAVFFMCAVLYFYRGKQNENFNEKIILYGFGCIFFGLALGRIFFCLSDLQIQGSYDHGFYGNFKKYNETHIIYVKLAFSFGLIGISIFIFSFELMVKRTKYILTIINGILITLILITPFELSRFITNYIGIFFNFFLFYAILLYFTSRARLELKAVTSFMLLGSTITFLGMAAYGYLVKESGFIPIYLAPVLCILGAIIAVIPTFVNPKYLSRASIYWLNLEILVIGVFFILIYFAFYYTIPFFYFVALSFFIFILIYLLYRTMNIIKIEKISEVKAKFSEEKEVKMEDVLGIFSKPQKITETEIMFHKEQKICLVCKNKISRLLYMCPECNALYCKKCSEALSTLENACWVCEIPIDESKPINILEKKEEEIKINEAIPKRVPKK